MTPAISMPDAKSGRHDAFISYSRKDKSFALLLEKALEKHALPTALRASGRRPFELVPVEIHDIAAQAGIVGQHVPGQRVVIVPPA